MLYHYNFLTADRIPQAGLGRNSSEVNLDASETKYMFKVTI